MGKFTTVGIQESRKKEEFVENAMSTVSNIAARVCDMVPDDAKYLAIHIRAPTRSTSIVVPSTNGIQTQSLANLNECAAAGWAWHGEHQERPESYAI